MTDHGVKAHNAATIAVHADDCLERAADVAPSLHTSTTFLAGNADDLIYSRQDQPTRRRLEKVLGDLEGGFAITYASGQAASFAVLSAWRPRRVAIDRGYFGTHDILARFEGLEVVALETPLSEGELLWLETPKNPYGEIEDIASLASRARESGAKVVVDSTLATPILQRPLALGADVALHSTTKFIAGHSDAMGGVLVVRDEDLHRRLMHQRDEIGTVPGSLETWLTLRSSRTLALRIKRHGESAAKIAGWLADRVPAVWHHSLTGHQGYELTRRQMDGFCGLLAFEVECEDVAQSLPRHLRLFRDATSLGSVNSTLEWRCKYDPSVSRHLLRVSVGLECADDLIDDLEQGLRKLKAIQ